MCVEGKMDHVDICVSGGDRTGRRRPPLPDLLEGTMIAADQRMHENSMLQALTSEISYSSPVAQSDPLAVPAVPKVLLKVPPLASDVIPKKTCVSTGTTTPCVTSDMSTTTVTFTETTSQHVFQEQKTSLAGRNHRQTARQSATPSQHISGYAKASVFRTDDDINIFEATFQLLRVCGFYYGKLGMVDAKRKLRRAAFGTYLLRDSSDSNYLYSLSVKTKRGTTSVRISYSRGQFQLDCDEALVDAVPSFDCVLKLIAHYTQDESRVDTGSACVFLESSGRRDTPIVLVRPYIDTVLSLRAACRKVVNRTVTSVEQRHQLFISDEVRCFLAEYPYAM